MKIIFIGCLFFISCFFAIPNNVYSQKYWVKKQNIVHSPTGTKIIFKAVSPNILSFSKSIMSIPLIKGKKLLVPPEKKQVKRYVLSGFISKEPVIMEKAEKNIIKVTIPGKQPEILYFHLLRVIKDKNYGKSIKLYKTIDKARSYK